MSKETKSNLKLIGAVATIISTLVLVGCGTDAAASSSPGTSVGDRTFGGLFEQKITLSDGRTVTCVTFEARTYNMGGVSCDWERLTADG